MPAAPTAQASVAPEKAAAFRSWAVPELPTVQVAPPSLENRSTPPAPTAKPWLAPAKVTAFRSLPVPELCVLQPAAAQAVAGSRAAKHSAATRPPVANSRRPVRRAIASTLPGA